METVFIVTHTHELPNGNEDIKFIGVYATEDAAEAAVERAKQLDGFRDSPTGFFVEPYSVGEDHWVEGFTTWIP